MTHDEFRAALDDAGLTQAAFARWLVEHGHTAQPATVARSVRRWAEVGPPGEVVVIMRLLAAQREAPCIGSA